MKKIFLFICLLSLGSTMALSQNSICDSVLYFLNMDKNISAKKLISKNNSDVNCLSKFGYSPLMLAASRGNYKMAKYLLEKGANPNLKNKDGETALFSAIYIYVQALEPNLSIKPKLKKYNYKIKDKIVELLIAYGADIYSVDSLQINLLMVACMHNRYEMVQLFVKSGIDINAKNDYGLTALMYSVKENYDIRIIRFLLKSGADKKLQDNRGRTALDFAKEADIKDKNIINLLNSNHH